MEVVKFDAVSVIAVLSLNTIIPQETQPLLSSQKASDYSQKIGQRRLRTETLSSCLTISNPVSSQTLTSIEFSPIAIDRIPCASMSITDGRAMNASASIRNFWKGCPTCGGLFFPYYDIENSAPDATLSIDTTIEKKKGMNYSLNLNHLGCDSSCYAYVSINGKQRFTVRPAKLMYLPDPSFRNSYIWETFDITSHLQDGQNTISIVAGDYSLRSLSITEHFGVE